MSRDLKIRLVLTIAGLIGASYLAGVLFNTFALRTLTNATPWTIFHYMVVYGHYPKIGKLIYLCWVLTGFPLASFAWMIFKPAGISPYGSAHWARENHVLKAGLRAKEGLILGRFRRQFLVAGGFEHVLCFAPTRSGKGVGLVIPNLLNWPGSAIVHDIKGENFEVTSGFRARHGQKVYFWNPGDPEGRTHCYNPLEFISRKPGQRIDDIQKIAHLILPEQEFWTNEARSLFVGLALYLIEKSTLSFGLILRTLRGQGNFVENIKKLLETEQQSMDPTAYMALNAFAQKADKEQSAVLSTMNAALELWANPLIDAATSKSDFDLRRLKKERTTIYVGVAPSNLHRLRPLMQIFYQQAIDMMTEKQPNISDEPHPVLFLMDEFPSLGRMTQFEQGIAYLAGYRVRLMLIIQDMPQLEASYQRSGMNVFMGNSRIRLTFASNNFETADLISRTLGTFGADTDSASRSKEMGLSLKSGSQSKSVSKISRSLLLPQEILQLSPNQEIVMVEAAPPVQAEKIRYFKDPVFRARLLPAAGVPIVKAAMPSVPALVEIEEPTESEVDKFLNQEDVPEKEEVSEALSA